jgi:dihydrofolate reductase
MRNISIIAACDLYGGISKNNTIPWINENVGKIDLKNFQKITKGYVCVMGVNTYNEIHDIMVAKRGSESPELLPGRQSVVITSNPNRVCYGASTKPSLRAARQSYEFDDYNSPIFVIGGRRLFIEAVAWAEDVYLTIINNNYECDQFFPLNTISKKFQIAEIDKQDGLTFVHYTRHERS